MYDETVNVVNAREIDSPSSEEEVVKATMSKFNPPVRHTARHDFDSDSETESDVDDKFLGNLSGEDQSPDGKSQPSDKSVEIPKASRVDLTKESSGRTRPAVKREDTSNSDTDTGDLEAERVDPALGSGRKRGGGVVIPAEGAYDPKNFLDLKVPPDMENIFQYIMKYTPQKIDIDLKLQPFVPEFVPAVGDIDAFIKVTTPACNVRAASLAENVLEHIDNLGLTVLDEPAAEQSDSALLHLQLRAISKTSSAKSTVVYTDTGDLEAERVDPALGSGRKRGGGVVIPAEGAYDPKNFLDLKVPPDMENIFQYIMKYTPQKIDIDLKLQPFVPEFVPAVGDIDAFIKVTTPACNVRAASLAENVLEHIDNLGLTVLDEPAAEQSDSALLHLQLRAISKTSSAKSTVLTKKIENAEKNSKAIERWIKDVSELHLSKPAPTVAYTSKMPDIDTLMEEWPESMEETLNEVGFPPGTLDCTLSQYVDLVCGLFDVPIAGDTLNDRIQALHLLFSLYSAVKTSQLYAERQKERSDSNA
uniref:Intraflagellar transport protein 46 homolog n=1 Tax=Heliothis virescens TaxID=7102 RepID=A0A2A4JU25_HELVI